MAYDYTPRLRQAEPGSGFATAQVLGGRFVKQTATPDARGAVPIAHCAAGEAAVGVAEYDSAPASLDSNAQLRLVSYSRSGDIARVKVGTAAINFNADVAADANGLAVTYSSGVKLGRATQTVAANAAFIEVELY
jgi:hypothetical protein